VDGNDGVQPVVLARQEGREFQAVDVRPQGVEFGADFGGDVLAFARKFQIRFQVA